MLDFLDHLETVRGNSARTRNARLAAIHSFMRYAGLRDPASLPVTGRVLAIPAKRFDRPVLGYLSREQVAAILAAPDRGTWSGRRDAVLLATAYNTGARVSELTGLRVRDVLLDRQTAVHLHGKGRKQRVIPLWKNTAAQLRGWLDQLNAAPDAPVFPNRAGAPMTRSGIGTGSTGPSLPPNSTARPCAASTSRRTRCGTRRPCTCCNRVPTWLSSRCGSGIPARLSRISTSKPTSPPRKQYYDGWATQAPRRRGSSPATGSWRSWKASDYVQPRDRESPEQRTQDPRPDCT